MSRPHALYRFFDSSGVLLYVGITMDPGSRWRTHQDDKPWWSFVAKITVETYPDRTSVLDAERQAIHSEQPAFNVVHNRGRHRTAISAARATEPKSDPARTYDSAVNEWEFFNKRSGHGRVSDLYLSWEVNGTAMSDDYFPDEISAHELLRRWMKRYGAQHVPIYWTVAPLHETAPFQSLAWGGEDFLSYFTWPRNTKNGEHLNFNRLPVLDMRWTTDAYDKGGFFQEATGWKPAPLQPAVDTTQVFAAASLPSPMFATPKPEEQLT